MQGVPFKTIVIQCQIIGVGDILTPAFVNFLLNLNILKNENNFVVNYRDYVTDLTRPNFQKQFEFKL